MTLAKLRREVLRLPLVALCVIVGSWIAVFLWPQGMSFGEPLADRVASAFRPSSYPAELLLVVAVLAASLVCADWEMPSSGICVSATNLSSTWPLTTAGNVLPGTSSAYPNWRTLQPRSLQEGAAGRCSRALRQGWKR